MALRNRIARLEDRAPAPGRGPRLVFTDFADFVRRLLTGDVSPADVTAVPHEHIEYRTRLIATMSALAEPADPLARIVIGQLRRGELAALSDEEWAALCAACRPVNAPSERAEEQPC
jgi:hypothetical protein